MTIIDTVINIQEKETSKPEIEFYLVGGNLVKKSLDMPNPLIFRITNGSNSLTLQAADESSYNKWVGLISKVLDSVTIVHKGSLIKQGSLIPTLKVRYIKYMSDCLYQ